MNASQARRLSAFLQQRPVLVALAGPNGAGKTTFYYSNLQRTGLRLVNADILAAELGIGVYGAAELAGAIRHVLIDQRESFVFETVFSDPVGDKLDFLKQAAEKGYSVMLCFIGSSTAEISEERVAVRVLQGGHDVPSQKIYARYPRVLANLRRAIVELPLVWIFDNADLAEPFQLVAVYESGEVVERLEPPEWLRALLPEQGSVC
jgi:predicted ABC-type ATPase